MRANDNDTRLGLTACFKQSIINIVTVRCVTLYCDTAKVSCEEVNAIAEYALKAGRL